MPEKEKTRYICILIPAGKIFLTPPLCHSNLGNLIQWIEFSTDTEINRNMALILVNVKNVWNKCLIEELISMRLQFHLA